MRAVLAPAQVVTPARPTLPVPMMTNDPSAVSARRRVISRSMGFTVPAGGAVLALAYAFAPAPAALEGPAERLVFTLRWLFVAFLPYAAVCLVILYRRFAEGSHNPLRHTPTPALEVHCRVMQNTLEQFVWFAFCLLPLATWLAAPQMRLVPVACVFFCVARLVYWAGYFRADSLGRAPGVQLTFTLNIALLVAGAVAFVRWQLG
jgi:uncharacterized membrane protein YecN with MAPEG domain